jgi:hypothetical protein
MRPRFKPVNFDDDFDENGVLKDGRRMRVPMMMMDSDDRVRVTDMFGGQSGLGRPGFRLLNDDAARALRDQAYAAYDQHLTDAWRTPAIDAAGEGAAVRRPDATTTDKPRSKQNAGADAFSMDARQAAYQKYDEEAQQAWRYAR